MMKKNGGNASKCQSPSATSNILRIPPKASSDVISRSMKSNRSVGTMPELFLARMIWHAGFRGYRKNYKRIPGKPDIFFPTMRLAIQLNGCFWHRCPYCRPSLPKSNREFWNEKFYRNKTRDFRQKMERDRAGIKSVVIWECQLKKYPNKTLLRVLNAISEQKEKFSLINR